MTEEVRKDPGNRLGNYIKTDKRSWLSEHAKFMRVHADLPIEKPLRRGCHVVNPDGEKYWVTFKYERLPNFASDVESSDMMKSIVLASLITLTLPSSTEIGCMQMETLRWALRNPRPQIVGA